MNRLVVAIVMMVVACIGTRCPAATSLPVLQEGDSIWEVNTRNLGGCPIIDAPVSISRYINCRFYQSSLEAFLADPVALSAPRTIIYVHGNWMETQRARERGLTIYAMLRKMTSEPIRMILFSWPSQREGAGVANDVREKAQLTNCESYYLADFLKHVPQDRPLSMIGFSFGGAIISGTLQLLADGSLEGRTLPAEHAHFERIRVSFVAPAFDREQLGCNGKYSLALSRVDKLVNLYNSHDPVLKRFYLIDRNSPIAAGFLGISPRVSRPLEANPKLLQFDCRNSAGRSHFELDYYTQCAAFRHSLTNVLGL